MFRKLYCFKKLLEIHYILRIFERINAFILLLGIVDYAHFLPLYLKRLIVKGKQYEKEIYQEELKGNQVTFFSYYFLFLSRNKRFADGRVSEINFDFYYLSSTLPLCEYMSHRHIHSEEKKVLLYVFFFFSFVSFFLTTAILQPGSVWFEKQNKREGHQRSTLFAEYLATPEETRLASVYQ